MSNDHTVTLGHCDRSLTNVDLSNEILAVKKFSEGLKSNNTNLKEADDAVRKIAGVNRLAYVCLDDSNEYVHFFSLLHFRYSSLGSSCEGSYSNRPSITKGSRFCMKFF